MEHEMQDSAGSMTTFPNGHNHHGPKNTNHVNGLHLACRECQRKKIKCDRTYPCGQCSRAALPCKASTRKPRAKASTKAVDAELRNRIAKLEKLVEIFQSDDGKLPTADALMRGNNGSADDFTQVPTPPSMSHANRSSASPSSPADAPSSTTNKYVAGTFWSSLTCEVKALADAFEEDGLQSDDDQTTPEVSPPTGPYALDGSEETSARYELIFCPPGALYIMPGSMTEPDPTTAFDVFNSYLTYVEPMHKLLHVPTLRPFMQEGQPYLGRAPDAPCNKALKAAIYFAGVSALTADECQSRYGKSRDRLVFEYMRMADIALYQADPLNTTDMATMQALVLYVASARILDSSRRAWSMVGLLVRIARAINIHRELPGETVFMAELKRRLWYGIVFLDCYASLDRGSEPAIHPDTFNRDLPSHVNDDDFDEFTTTLASREGEITDMSLALIAMEGSALSLQMAIPEDLPSGQKWQQRLEMAYAFQKKVNEKYIRHLNPDNVSHRVVAGVGTAASHSMILRAVRPMQHHPSNTPPRVDSPWVMQLALNILRHSDRMWEGSAGLWRRMPWVPWHAMAVTFAGLCSIRGTALANEAWILVEKAMARYEASVADSKNGMLWRPLEKLRKKASAFRDGGNEQRKSDEKLNTTAAAFPPVQQLQEQPALWNIPPNDITFDGTTLPLQPALELYPSDMILNPDIVPPLTSTLDFPLEMQAALPSDTSWLDWESILQDMDNVRSDDMQWM